MIKAEAEKIMRDHLKIMQLLDELSEGTDSGVDRSGKLVFLQALISTHQQYEEQIFTSNDLGDVGNMSRYHSANEYLIRQLLKTGMQEHEWCSELSVLRTTIYSHLRQEESQLQAMFMKSSAQ